MHICSIMAMYEFEAVGLCAVGNKMFSLFKIVPCLLKTLKESCPDGLIIAKRSVKSSQRTVLSHFFVHRVEASFPSPSCLLRWLLS